MRSLPFITLPTLSNGIYGLFSDIWSWSVMELLIVITLGLLAFSLLFYLLKSLVKSFCFNPPSSYHRRGGKRNELKKNMSHSERAISYLISLMLILLCGISLVSLLYFYQEKSTNINDARVYLSKLPLAINKFRENIIERVQNYKKIIQTSEQNAPLLFNDSTNFQPIIAALTVELEEYIDHLRTLPPSANVNFIITVLKEKVLSFRKELELLFVKQRDPLSPIPRYDEIILELDRLLMEVRSNSSDFLHDASVMVGLIERAHSLCFILVIVIILLSIFLLLLSIKHRNSSFRYPSILHQTLISVCWFVLFYIALNPEFYMVPIFELPSSKTLNMKSAFPKIVDTIIKGIKDHNNDHINILLKKYNFETEVENNIITSMFKSLARCPEMFSPNFEGNRAMFEELRSHENDVELFNCDRFSVSTKDILRVKTVHDESIFKEKDHCGLRIQESEPIAGEKILLFPANILGLVMIVASMRDPTNASHSYPDIRLNCLDNVWATIGLGEGDDLVAHVPHSSKFRYVCEAYYEKYKDVTNDFVVQLLQTINTFTVNNPTEDEHIDGFMKLWHTKIDDAPHKRLIKTIKESHDVRMERIRGKLETEYKTAVTTLIPQIFGVEGLYEDYMEPIMDEFTRIFSDFGPVMKLMYDGFGLTMSF